MKIPEGWKLIECSLWTEEQIETGVRNLECVSKILGVEPRTIVMCVAGAMIGAAPDVQLSDFHPSAFDPVGEVIAEDQAARKVPTVVELGRSAEPQQCVVVVGEEHKPLGDAIDAALNSYRLQHTHLGDGEGFPLVDALTPPDQTGIELGIEERVLLSDHIYLGVSPLMNASLAREAELDRDNTRLSKEIDDALDREGALQAELNAFTAVVQNAAMDKQQAEASEVSLREELATAKRANYNAEVALKAAYEVQEQWKARCARRVEDIQLIAARLTATEQRNVLLSSLLEEASDLIKPHHTGLLRSIAEALTKPTESGASE